MQINTFVKCNRGLARDLLERGEFREMIDDELESALVKISEALARPVLFVGIIMESPGGHPYHSGLCYEAPCSA